MAAPLRRVLMRAARGAMKGADAARWHYGAGFDPGRAAEQHDGLAGLVAASGAEILWLDDIEDGLADSVFTHDPSLMTDFGAIILRMGKPLRRGEETAIAQQLTALDMPILATLHGDACAEGGDLLWLDERTLAVGLGFRTNAAGLAQLSAALAPLGVRTLPVELPYYAGPEACLHLLSLISIVDERLAVVYPPLLPVPFWQELERRHFRLVACPEAEFAGTMGTNVLALAPGDCLMLEGNPITGARLEAAGCAAQTYRGNEISLKAEGGATCLTRPILRG